jgi:ABC-type branched-subunit amino acid transport system ATPase component/ABC-type branched-subunit amino acid transport system permease subunit
MLSVVISGVITGLLYALAGQAKVVVYRTTKVLNFGIAGQGVIVAYVAYEMLTAGISYWIVFPVAILLGGILGGVLERLIIYPLRRQPVLTIAVSTLGILLLLEGIAGWIWGFSPKALTPAFADAGTLRMGEFAMSANQIFILVVSVVATAMLLYLIEKTKLGLGMRATSSGPLTASILGVNVSTMRFNSWVIGGAYGALAALLVTPLTYLSPTGFIAFILSAIAAIVVGGFTNIVGVVVGAILFGIGSNLIVTYVDNGLISTFTFVVVALVLLFKPHGLFGRPEKHLSEPEIINRKPKSLLAGLFRKPSKRVAEIPALTPTTKRRIALVGWLVAATIFSIIPFVGGPSMIYLVGMILATYIAALGVNVVTGYTGEVSLATSGLALIGAYTLAISLREGFSLPVAIIFSILASGLVGAGIGFIATRVSGIYLVVLTLLFTFVVPELAAFFRDFTGGIDGIPVFSKMVVGAQAQYWLVLTIAALVTVVTLWLTGGRVGRNWRAVRDSSNGARALGLNPATVKLGAFIYGSILAGLAGGLIVLLTAFVGTESFLIFWAIYMLLAVVLGGAGSIGGTLIGSAFVVWVPKNTGDMPVQFVFGLALIAVLMIAPNGIAGLYERMSRLLLARFGRRNPLPHTKDSSEDHPSPAGVTGVVEVSRAQRRSPHQPIKAQPIQAASDALLVVDGVSTGYGAGMVLRGLSLTVNPGEMVTLLGANGAGKSTALRTISGLLPIVEGSISWGGRKIGERGLHTPSGIARSHLAHVPEGRGIFPDLTVIDNLRLGKFADSQQSKAEFAERMEQVFEYFPILKERLKQDGGTLSGGEQQMLAIGRALMGSPKLLMLDEPSLGLSPLYSQQVLQNLRRIVDDGNTSVLLIEQNARAALECTDRAYVLSRGSVVVEGSAETLLNDHDLFELYLAVEA